MADVTGGAASTPRANLDTITVTAAAPTTTTVTPTTGPTGDNLDTVLQNLRTQQANAGPSNTVVSNPDRRDDNNVQQTPTAGTAVAGPPQSPATPPAAAPSKDMRVRLSALDPSIFTGILAPLKNTGGMLFPYTPQISYNQSVSYADISLVHSNTDYAAYTRTPSLTVSISGKLTVQSQLEGKYALACLHFLRAASKSHFGENDTNAGLPPPILTLDGYGTYMFKRLRVILKSHSWTFDENIDTIAVNAGKGLVRLPALFTVSCELTVVQTPTRMRTKFNFGQFASGQLMEQQEGWI